MPTAQALDLARERGLDLVEVAPTASPPVCRLLDYGKFKYEQSKRDREARKHQKQVVLREVRMKPKIDDHDIAFKTRTAEKLLREGDKVKVSIMFRGRELTHPQIGAELLDRVYQQLKDIAVIEKQPSLEGRFMTMILVPGSGTKAQQPRERAGQPASQGRNHQPAPATGEPETAPAPPAPAAAAATAE